MDNLGSRLKDIRLKAGLSLRELARKVDVSPSFISQIENGKSQPSVATLYAFSQQLNVSVDELFGDDDSESQKIPVVLTGATLGGADIRDPTTAWQPTEYSNRISVLHPSHRSRLNMAAGVVWERLAATPEGAVNFMKIVYAPGATSTDGGDLISHPGYEYGYVLAGQVEVTVGGEVFVLHAGESLGFDSSIPHLLRNSGDEDFQGIWVVHGSHR